MTPSEKQDVIENLQFVICMMELNYSVKTFFTSHMVVRNYIRNFPRCGLKGWEIRALIRQPFFYLDDKKGWRNN